MYQETAGGGNFDSPKLARIDDHHVKSTQWMGSKQAGETTRDLSADGQATTMRWIDCVNWAQTQ